MEMTITALANKITSPNDEGDLASYSIIFGITIDNEATSKVR